MRVLTYNIAFGPPEQLDNLTSVLQSYQADVVTLNEADDPEVVACLAERLGMDHLWGRGSGNRHVATLSRYPILRHRLYNRKPITQAVLVTELDVRPTGGEPLWVYNVHLRPDPYWHFEAIRWLAVNSLLWVTRDLRPRPRLLMGDLNSYGRGDPVDVATIRRFMNEAGRRQLSRQQNRFLRLAVPRLLLSGYVDCFRQAQSQEPGYTMARQGQPVSRVDYILACPQMAPHLGHCQVATDHPLVPTISDHFPLLAEFN